MPRIRTIDDLAVKDRRVIIRLDLNVPVKNGAVTDATRIERSLPTLRELLDKGASLVVLSHFGRPDGKVVPEMSLRPIGPALASAIGRPVNFIATDWRDDAPHRAAESLSPGQIILPDNTRFHPGEEDNDPSFARLLAALGDVYVDDAFSAAHRAHASTEGIAHERPSAAGRAMEAEIAALTRALEDPKRPLAAIVGGAKISSKLDLLSNLVAKVDTLIIGGAMANTFLAAQGRKVGKSLIEPDRLETARGILARAGTRKAAILLPLDAVVARELKAGVSSRVTSLDQVAADEMILASGTGLWAHSRPSPSTRRRSPSPATPQSARVKVSLSPSPAGAILSLPSTRQALPQTSPMCRPPAALFSNGSKARPFRASKCWK
jgi:phosphoglycerate kinase